MRAACLAVFWFTTSFASAADIFVSARGQDSWPGTADRPFATLERARDSVRALKTQGALKEPVRVLVAGGEYVLTRPLEFTPADSGTPTAPISYEAQPGSRPVFSGGRTISGWQPAGDGLWKTEIPEVAAGDWYFEQLWVNGRRASGAESHVENRGDAIVVTAETAASGKHSLKIVDAPGLRRVYYPYLAYSAMSFGVRPLRNAFDLCIEPKSQVQVEWRDYSEGEYRIGLGFAIRNGRLEAGQAGAMDLPIGEWIHVEIDDTPADGRHTWNLRVSAPGQASRVFANLKAKDPRFKRLTWIGFISMANEKTVFYLDNFDLRIRRNP